MFSKFLNLNEHPFAESPSPKYFFGSQSHLSVFNRLSWAIQHRKGFSLVTGEVGTGKTLLSRMILNSRGSKDRTALILYPRLSEVELLKSICEEFGLPKQAISRIETVSGLLEVLNAFLLHNAREAREAVLVIDEAQKLYDETLETIRLLNNLETENSKLLQIILVGQTELEKRVMSVSMRQLAQRISVMAKVSPLGFDEVEKYVHHRLTTASESHLVRFDQKAIKFIYSESRGIPRLINRYCEMALLAAELNQVRLIDAKLVKDALSATQPKRIKHLFAGGNV